MKFIENIVTDKVMERAKRIFLQDHFGWFYNSSTSKIRPGDKTVLMDEQTKESIQFTHKLYTDGTFDSEYVDFIMKIMKGLEEKEGIVCTKMLRAKCNLLPQDASYGTDFYHPPHVDIINPTDINYSLIYYVNNSDGDTILFNEQFGDEFDDTMKCIVNGWYKELPELTFDQEVIIQHALIYKHNLNLKTWQLSKFTNTKQLYQLLEPNIHDLSKNINSRLTS